MAVNSAFHTSNLHSLATERDLYKNLVKEAIQIEPNNAATLGNLGAALKETGKFKEAVIACEKAIQIETNNLVANRNLALIFIELGEIQQAQAAIDHVFSIKSDLNINHLKEIFPFNSNEHFDILLDGIKSSDGSIFSSY